ncbi:MAG: 50S ribosomal protein L29 [Bacteroidota bacterium]|nr:50S ribosomal protein L29 [Bacteroidota bacterium]MDP4225177.1 50S ribosomal protein L29 [Bacteroidota bacterium]MDP4272815.1 50S ribosomal protein L29 [Bacteroidota bacterium]
MKTEEIKEIKDIPTKELGERLDAEKNTLIRLKLSHAISPLDNPNKIKITRRNVARMMTELRRRTLNK